LARRPSLSLRPICRPLPLLSAQNSFGHPPRTVFLVRSGRCLTPRLQSRTPFLCLFPFLLHTSYPPFRSAHKADASVRLSAATGRRRTTQGVDDSPSLYKRSGSCQSLLFFPPICFLLFGCAFSDLIELVRETDFLER